MEIYVVCTACTQKMQNLAKEHNLKLDGTAPQIRRYVEKDYRASRTDPQSTEPKVRKNGEIKSLQLLRIQNDEKIRFPEFSSGNVFYDAKPIGQYTEVYLLARGSKDQNLQEAKIIRLS